MRKLSIVAAVLAAALAAGAAAGATGGAVVKTRTTGLGRVLVDAQGRSLYLFEADKSGRSACYGTCAKFWPPLLTTAKPRAAAGAKAALLGTIRRTDGRLQVTYRGHPLYLFVKDAKAGQTSGEGVDGFGGLWYVLAPSGASIVRQAAATAANPPATTTAPATTTPSSGGGGGYGGY